MKASKIAMIKADILKNKRLTAEGIRIYVESGISHKTLQNIIKDLK